MTVRVFYSWQSDRRQNRNFIRSALEAAVRELRQDLALEEAQRDIILDRDTQGLPAVLRSQMQSSRKSDQPTCSSAI